LTAYLFKGTDDITNNKEITIISYTWKKGSDIIQEGT
jgi:hypothetical protein